MKAVIYARYSSDNQREESIEGQIRECTAFAEKNDFQVLRHYIDRAYSAKTDHRPAFQEMIKDSAKHLFDVVIVWKLDRFSRNRYDSARYKNTLKHNGVKVISATEVISEGAEGIILESVLEGYAEYYSKDLSEKVVRGMTENLLKGKFNGGSIPLGYTIDSEKHFQIDPVIAPLIVEAFERYAAGATMKEVRTWLNQKGVKNPRGNEMSHNSVRYMLHNRRYIGEYEFRGEVNMNVIPPIVSKELFDRVQRRIEESAKAPARHKAEEEYLLTTKLYCGYCGAYLCGECGTSRTGDIYHYYKCVSPGDSISEPVFSDFISFFSSSNVMVFSPSLKLKVKTILSSYRKMAFTKVSIRIFLCSVFCKSSFRNRSSQNRMKSSLILGRSSFSLAIFFSRSSRVCSSSSSRSLVDLVRTPC